MKKESLSERSLLDRREMLLRGGKGFAAALGLAAIGGPGRRDLLNLLLPTEPLPNLAGARLISFEPELEAEVEEVSVLSAEDMLGGSDGGAGSPTKIIRGGSLYVQKNSF